MWWTQAKFIVAVVVVVWHKDRVLLLKHSYRPRYPWGLPTGWVGYGETPEAAARREVLEESGLVVNELRWFLTQYPSKRHLEICYWTEADQTGGLLQLSKDGEILASEWALPDARPDGLMPSQFAIIEEARRIRLKISQD